ncbi:MAG: CCA tRNA nucleotidyltransferase [Thermoflexales bacterium]|nr:CCA tRNA nucleotidyltransferase [Thermoflexales bacterium]
MPAPTDAPLPSSLLDKLSPLQQRVLRAIQLAADDLAIPVYLVGGAVRDWLLGVPAIDDLDFVVEGNALTLAETLRAREGGAAHAYPRFGTATWFLDGAAVDIAAARKETYPHPASLPVVSPTDLETDLHRRDFTVNAMALRLRDAALIDPLSGQRDLAARSLRALHPNSFVDDPTRLLRGARYAARLGFSLAPETQGWMAAGLPYLRALSGERVKYDLELIFEEPTAAQALSLLSEWGAFRTLGIPVPDAAALQQRFEAIQSILEDSETWQPAALGLRSRVELRHALGWGALTYNLGQLGTSRWVSWIPFTHVVRDALVSLGALSSLSAGLFVGARASQQSELLSPFSGLALCIGYAFERNPLKREAMRHEWTVWRHVRPALNGDDLRQLGLPPGPQYARLLKQLRQARLDGEVHSPEEERELIKRIANGE